MRGTGRELAVATARRRARRIGAAALCALAACGGDGGGGDAASTAPPPAVVDRVEITPAAPTLEVGSTLPLAATPRDANGNALSGRPIVWRSASENVASVDATGLVRALAAGTAAISATVEGRVGTATVSVRPPVRPPTAVTLVATEVTSSGVMLNGSVNPNGAPTTWTFELGVSAALGERCTPSGTTLTGETAQTVQCRISGQPAGRQIFYRVSATNAAGTVTGATLSVTTLNPGGPPTVRTLAADSITATGANLPLVVRPNGRRTTVTVEFGVNAAAPTTSCTPAAVEATTVETTLWCRLRNQPAGANVVYRAVATSDSGTARGELLSVRLQDPPTGGQAAGLDRIVASAVRLPNGSGLWSFSADGAPTTFISGTAGLVWEAAWSPDRRRLAFGRGLPQQIAVINTDGTGLRDLTTTGGSKPAWSPDGRRIAFARAPGALTIMDADGTNVLRPVGIPSNVQTVHWSPDGRRIAFGVPGPTGTWTLFTVDAQGGDLRLLVEVPGTEVHARWSPDGSRLLVTGLRDGTTQLFTVNADATGLRPLTSGPARRRFPTWSPDGRRIAYTVLAPGDVERLAVANADGTGERIITTGLAEAVLWPAWGP